jgi:hypothetical protein
MPLRLREVSEFGTSTWLPSARFRATFLIFQVSGSDIGVKARA